ncbi:MAG TPA: LamG-like jellyroll fold domain-containing protein [Candidatus Deferrimicrobium sp.]|nr:LamG-like jellyroll fold domain-containing protein [Candidatus Deferrimicrobium sp.]
MISRKRLLKALLLEATEIGSLGIARVVRAVVVVLLATAPLARSGNIYLTGHDVDYHWGQFGYDQAILDLLRCQGTPDEILAANYQIAVIGSQGIGVGIRWSGTFINTYPAVTFIDADIQTTPAAWSAALETSTGSGVPKYNVLVMLSHESCGGGCGLTTAGSNNLNQAQALIATLFNNGMDIWANSGAGLSTYYDFLPPGFITTVPYTPYPPTSFCPTPAGTAVSITCSMTCGFQTHNRFTGFAAALIVTENDCPDCPVACPGPLGPEVVSLYAKNINLPGPSPLEACCLPDGCQMLTPQSCIAAGGTPMGSGTQCTTPEACCFRGGGCAVMDPLCCVFQATGTPGGPACLGDNNGDGIDDACLTPCTPAPSGMVAWWPLDETSGPTAFDIATPGVPNNGTWMNDPTPEAQGHVAGALRFDGDNDYLEVLNVNGLSITNAITIDAWINTSDLGGINTYQKIVSKFFFTGYYLRLDPGGAVGFYARQSISSGPGLIQANTWYHIAGTYDGAIQKIYVNGGLVASESVSGPITDVNTPVVIGATSFSPNQWFFKGLIDDVEIFNRALTEPEVQRIYDAGSAGKCKSKKAIPTLTEWGMIIFCAFLFGWMAWVIVRRRRRVTVGM